MIHTDNHMQAFLDVNNLVIAVNIFDGHNESLIQQVKEFHNAADVKSCSIYGQASAGDEFYNGKFYGPKPFPSWIRNEELGQWDAPVPYPELDQEDPKSYVWNEDTCQWETVIN
jgi:hypothetical protein